MLEMIGLVISAIALIGVMIAPSVAFVPVLGGGVSWLAANAFWILPAGLFFLFYGLTRDIIKSLAFMVVIFLVLKFMLGVPL